MRKGYEQRDTAACAEAVRLLTERCAECAGDSSAVLGAVQATVEELTGSRALPVRFGPESRVLATVARTSSSTVRLAVDETPALAIESGAIQEVPVSRSLSLAAAIAVPLGSAERCQGVVLVERETLSPGEVEALRTIAAVGCLLLASAVEFERLRRASDLTSGFVALAAHELRAPFAIMHGIIATLRLREDLPADHGEALRDALYRQSERTGRLIEQLLDLSRLDAGAIPLERSWFPIRDRVEDVVETVAGPRGGEVTIDVPDELEIEADPGAFDRIVANLVANALRHGSGPITVAARQRDRHFRLSVEDCGSGVDTSFVPRLFERFARNGQSGDGTTSGLGLSIAQSYAQAHGGELLYTPASPHGARFELVLPRPPQDAAAERSVSSTSPA